MAAPTVMTGARAKVYIGGKLVGIFNSVAYGLSYDVLPAYVLGRYDAASTDYTGQEVINITASGWRVIGNGPMAAGQMPSLGELMTHQEIEFQVFDRHAPAKPICKITGVRPVSYNTSINARSLSELQMTFVGRQLVDESASDTKLTVDKGAVGDDLLNG